MQDISNEDTLSVLETLFKESNFIAEMKFNIPSADYHSLLKMLKEHEDFFKSRNISWSIIHNDTGFILRIDRINKLHLPF